MENPDGLFKKNALTGVNQRSYLFLPEKEMEHRKWF
jgi:hypothetical protein